jgi:FkbM family methyltransferase
MVTKKILNLILFLFIPLICFSNYPEYKQEMGNYSKLWYFLECNYDGVYLKDPIINKIDKNEVTSILEIGSRDLRDAFNLSKYYKCHVFAFECNPDCLEVCRINDIRTTNVTLIEKAVWDKTGSIKFYPTFYESKKYSDPGRSSCFRMNSEFLTKYSQKTIEVQATRLDDWLKEKEIDKIDMLCINANGASLNILKGMGDYIKNTKYIITKCEYPQIYENETQVYDLIIYLSDYGFDFVPTDFDNDFIFKNRNLLKY